MSGKMKGHLGGVRKSTRTIKKTRRVLESADISLDDELENPPKKPKKSSKPLHKIDYCKNGEPFSCSMCESTYINTSVAKAKTKLEKYPIERERNGVVMQLCVQCSTALTKLENKGPSPKEREEFEEEGKQFGDYWSKLLKEPDACRLYCSLYQTIKCGCIQNYVNGTLNSSRKRKTSQTIVDNGQFKSTDPGTENNEVLPPEQSDPCEKMKFFISLLKESKAKKDNLKMKRKVNAEEVADLGKTFDNYILSNRAKLKNAGICERGCQKVLCYSNNYLHKKPSTSEARLQKTKVGLRVSHVFDLGDLHKQRCCEKKCCKLTAKNVDKLKEWRQQAQVNQKTMWKVISEMIGSKDGGATTGYCTKFITMVTGCCITTVKKVYYNMLLTKGEIIKPQHEIKHNWLKPEESAEVSASQSSSQKTALPPNLSKKGKRAAPAGGIEVVGHSKVRVFMSAGPPPSATLKLEDASTATTIQPQQKHLSSVDFSSNSTSLCYGQKEEQESDKVKSLSGFACSVSQPSIPNSLPLKQQGSTLINPTASPAITATLDSPHPVDYEQKLKKEIPQLCSNLENFESTVKLLELVSGLVEIQRHKETMQVTQNAVDPLSSDGSSASANTHHLVHINSKVSLPVPSQSEPTVVQSSSQRETGAVTLVSNPPPCAMFTSPPTSMQRQTSHFTPTTSVSEMFQKRSEVRLINAETLMSTPAVQLLGNPNYVQVANPALEIGTPQGVLINVNPPSSAAGNIFKTHCPGPQGGSSNNQINLNSQTVVPVQYISMQNAREQQPSLSSYILTFPKASPNQLPYTVGQSSTSEFGKSQLDPTASGSVLPLEIQDVTTQASAQIALNMASSESSQSGLPLSSRSNSSFIPYMTSSIESAKAQNTEYSGIAFQLCTDNISELDNKLSQETSVQGIFPKTVLHMNATHPPTKRTMLFSNNPEDRNHLAFNQLGAQVNVINNPDLLTKNESQFSPLAHSSHQHSSFVVTSQQEHQASFQEFKPSSTAHQPSPPQGSSFTNIFLETPSSCSSFAFDALSDSPVKDSSLQASPMFQPTTRNSILCDILVGSGPLSSNPNTSQPVSSMETLAVSESQRHLKHPSFSGNHLQNSGNESVLHSTGQTTPRQFLTVGHQYGTSGTPILSQNDLSCQQGLIKVSRLSRTKDPPQVGIVNPYISSDSTPSQPGLLTTSERASALSDNNQESDQRRLGQPVDSSGLVQHLLNGDTVRADAEHQASHTNLQTFLEDLSHAISSSVGSPVTVSDVQGSSITSIPSHPRINVLSQTPISVDQNNVASSSPYQGQLVNAMSSSSLNQAFFLPAGSTSQSVPWFFSAMVCPDTGQIKVVPLMLATDQTHGTSLYSPSQQSQPANQIACNNLPFPGHMSTTLSNSAANSATNLNAMSGNTAQITVPTVQTQQVAVHQDTGPQGKSSSMTVGLKNNNIQLVLKSVDLQMAQVLPQVQMTGNSSQPDSLLHRPPAFVQKHVNSGTSNVMEIDGLGGQMIIATSLAGPQINAHISTQRQSLGSSTMTSLSTHTSSSPSSVVFSTATVVPGGGHQAVNIAANISGLNQPALVTSGQASRVGLYTRPQYQMDRVQISSSAQPVLNVESSPETAVTTCSEGLNIFTIPINQTAVSALHQQTQSIFVGSNSGSVMTPSNQQRTLLPKPQESHLQTVSAKANQNCTFYLVPNQPNYPTYQIAMCSNANLNSQPEDFAQNIILAAQQTDNPVPPHQFPSQNIQHPVAFSQTPQGSKELPSTVISHPELSLGVRVEPVQPQSPQPSVTQSSVSFSASQLAPIGANQSKLYTSPVTSLAEVSHLAHFLQQPPTTTSSQSQQVERPIRVNLSGGTQLKSFPGQTSSSVSQDPLSYAPTTLETLQGQSKTLATNGTSILTLSKPIKDQSNSGSHLQMSSGARLDMPPISTNILGERSQLRNKEIIDLTEDSPPPTPISKQNSSDAEKDLELKRSQERLQNYSSEIRLSNVQYYPKRLYEMLSNLTEKSPMNQMSQTQILQSQQVAKDISTNVQILFVAQNTNPSMTMSATTGSATQEPVDKSLADILHSLSSQSGNSSNIVQGASSQLGFIGPVKSQDGSTNLSQAIYHPPKEVLQSVASASTPTVTGPEAMTPRNVNLSCHLNSAQKEKSSYLSSSMLPSSCTLVSSSGFSLSFSTSQSVSPSVAQPSVSMSCLEKPQITSFVAFTRATNTPTDAVGPPNITVMSPSRIGARLRLESNSNLVAIVSSNHATGTTSSQGSTTLSSLKLTGTNTSMATKPVPPVFNLSNYSHLKVSPALNSSATPSQSPESSFLSRTSLVRAGEGSSIQKAANITKPRKKPSTIMQLLKEKESLQQNTVQSTSTTVSSISMAQPIVDKPVVIISSNCNQSVPSAVVNLTVQPKNVQQSSTNQNSGEPQACSGQATLTVLETNKPSIIQGKESSQLVLHGNASQGVKPPPHSLQTFSHSSFQQPLSNTPSTNSETSIFPKTVSSSLVHSSLQKAVISNSPVLISGPKLKFVNQTSGSSPLSFFSSANSGSSNQKPLTLFNQKQNRETSSLQVKEMPSNMGRIETGIDQADPKHACLSSSTVLQFIKPKQIVNLAGSSTGSHLLGTQSVGLKLRSPAQPQASPSIRVPSNVMLIESIQRNNPTAEFTQAPAMSEEINLQNRKPTDQPQPNKLVFSTGQAILTTTNPILSNILFSQNNVNIESAQTQAYISSAQKDTFGEKTNTNKTDKTALKVNLTNVENNTMARMFKTEGTVSIHELNQKHLFNISRHNSSTLVTEQYSENLKVPLQEIIKPSAFTQSHIGKSDRDHGKHETMKNGRIEKIIDDMYSRADDCDEMAPSSAQIYQKKGKADFNSSVVYGTNEQALVAQNSGNTSERNKMLDSDNKSHRRVKGGKPVSSISKKTVKFSDQVSRSGHVEYVSQPENPDQSDDEQTHPIASHLMNYSDRETLHYKNTAQYFNQMEKHQNETKLKALLSLDAEEQEQCLMPGQKTNQSAQQNVSVYRQEMIPDRPSDSGSDYIHAHSSVEVLRPRQEYLIENIVVDMSDSVAPHQKDEALWPKAVGYYSSQPAMKNAPQRGFSASKNDLLSYEQSHGVGTESNHSSFNILSDKGYSKLSNTRKMATVTEEVHSVKQTFEPSSSIISSSSYKKAHQINHSNVLKVNSDCKDVQGSQTNITKAEHFHVLATEHKQKKFDHHIMKEVILSHDLFSMPYDSHDSYMEGQLEHLVTEKAKNLESLNKANNERQQKIKQLKETIAKIEMQMSSSNTPSLDDVYGDKKLVSIDVQHQDVESKKRHSSANSKTSPELARQLAYKNRDTNQTFHQGYVSMEEPMFSEVEEAYNSDLMLEPKSGSFCDKPQPSERCEKGKDPLVSSSSLSRPSSQMEIEPPHYESHIRHRYSSTEFKSLYRLANEQDSFLASMERHRHPSNSQRPLELDLFSEIRDRQRNPSSGSLKLGLLDLEFLNAELGTRSRHPSYSMEPFPAIRSRNPSGSSNRRSRPGSSSSDREFPGMEDLGFFSDIGRSRSRNSSGESLEPTVGQIDDHTLKLYGHQSKH